MSDEPHGCTHKVTPGEECVICAVRERAAHSATLENIKYIALNMKPDETPVELAHIVRICIDALQARQKGVPDAQFATDEVRGALEAAYSLNEHIAGAYVLSLSDFRYLNNVSTQIKAVLGRASEA